jgi:hypothetical protein
VIRAVSVLVVVIVAAVASSAGAGSSTSWQPVASQKQSSSSQIGLYRSGDGVLHVVWTRQTESFSYDLLHTPISAAGAVGSGTPIVAGWSAIGDAVLVAGPGGGMQVFFNGSRSTNAGEPLFGLNTATAPRSGTSWSLTPASIATRDFAYGRTPGATLARDGAPLETWYSAATTVVHRSLDPGSPDYEYPVGAGGASSFRPNIVTDPSTGRVFVAWCTFGSTNGVFVEEVDPTTGAPAGPAHLLPGSTTSYQGQEQGTCNLESAASRMPLAARVRGGIYVATAAGYPTLTQVLVWHLAPDGSVAQTLTVASSKNGHTNVALAASADGRISVGWSENPSGIPQIVVRRSNAAGTAFEAPVATSAPPGAVQLTALDLAPQAQAVDVLGRFSTASETNLWHTQLSFGPNAPGGGAVAQPVPGRSIVAAKVSGTVLVRREGTNSFLPLGTASIPTGSEVDTTRGRVRVTSAAGGGKTQTSDFYQGRFVVTQVRAGKLLTTLSLSAPLTCSRRIAGTAATRERHLWGNGKGSFRTRGKFAAATVRGTIWFTQDTCTTTTVRVRQGRVDVFDTVRKTTVQVPAGKSYTARRR